MAIEFLVGFLQTFFIHILTSEHEDSHLMDLCCEYRNNRDWKSFPLKSSLFDALSESRQDSDPEMILCCASQ